MKKYFFPLVLMLFFTGCSYKGGYNPSYVQEMKTSTLSKNSSTKVAVLTTKEQDNKVIVQKPTSFTGSATTLEIPIGAITRELTYEYFAQFYSNINRIDELSSNYNIIISPSVTHFEYEYDQLSNLGFAITPKLSCSLTVQVYKKKTLVLSKVYESGVKSADAYMVSGQPGERINRLLHQTLFQLLSQVQNDINRIK